MTMPTRPVLRWHGGKWLLAPWVISHFPPHRVYVEPFGGAASVLMRKPRAYAEVYNDLDGEVVNLFRVLRDPGLAGDLQRRLRLTPFARAEFTAAYEVSEDPIESARRLIVRSYMGWGSTGTHGHSTGFRSNTAREATVPAHDWAAFPEALDSFVERLRGVVVEQRDAMKVMADHDAATTLHYVDPPYLPETRSRSNPYCAKHRYRHEMTVEDHVGLLTGLRQITGMVVLSGYPSALYEDALAGWRRVERKALADGARERTEVLWLNPAATEALGADHGPLWAYGGAA